MSLYKLNQIIVFNKCVPKRFYASDVSIKKTSLHEFHVKNGGKMVPFANYLMPVKYTDSITSSHLHTRHSCSLFDVSHMLQTKIYGKHRDQFLERICVTDVQNLKKCKSALSLFVNDKTGGILDDLIITKTDEDYLYMVTNAGCKEQDMQMLIEQSDSFKSSGHDVTLEFLDSDEQSLLALQGPSSASVLQPLVSVNLSKLYFMDSTTATVCGVHNCRINRCGYTGEDGFEISVPSNRVEAIAEMLVDHNRVKLAGLGARDTLRLEAGMCLHGADISSLTTPVEAALVWTISRKRRDERLFPGASVILKQLGEGVRRKRVGLVQKNQGGAPARGGAALYDEDGEQIGTVTSGCPSPTLLQNIAMGYVDSRFAKNGTEIKVAVRGQRIPMIVTKMPFVKTNYYSKPKQ